VTEEHRAKVTDLQTPALLVGAAALEELTLVQLLA
jgi:hypothetical protein